LAPCERASFGTRRLGDPLAPDCPAVASYYSVVVVVDDDDDDREGDGGGVGVASGASTIYEIGLGVPRD